MKQRVLFVLPTLHAGGTENYALRFIRFYGNESVEWHVLSLNQTKGDLHEEFSSLGCRIHYQSIGYLNIMKFYKFYDLLKKYRFDIICTFNGNFGGVPLAIASIAGIKHRIAWHRRSTNAFHESYLKVSYNKLANRLIRRYATTILSNSRFALGNFYNDYWLKDNRFKIIRNGLDIKMFSRGITRDEARKQLGLPLDKFIIGHVGRYAPAKNHETIFKVAAEIKLHLPEIHFLFCGKDTDSDLFKRKLEEYGITSISFTMGLVEDVPLLYKSFDLFFFPSVTEGQPNALIEAMVSDIPILTSNIPSILEVLPEEIAGQMPSPLDHGAFTAMILQLKEDLSKRDLFRCLDYARNRFDGKENFELFKRELYIDKPKRKVLFAFDGYLYQDVDGAYFGVYVDAATKNRYLSLGDHVTFLMRLESLEEGGNHRYSPILSDNFSFIEVPNFKSIRRWVKYHRKAKKVIEAAVKENDVVVARLPSAIGRLTIEAAKKFDKPHLVEFVGCTFDGYWNYNWKGKLIAHFKLVQMQKLVQGLPYVIYVTKEFLQRRYPTRGKQISCSNVELNALDDSDLIQRLERIHRCNVKEMVVATIAAIDVPYKGQDDIIKVIAHLNNNEGWHLRYKIIGQGNPTRLKEIAQQLGITNDVEIVGSLKHAEVFDQLRDIELYIQPSKQEGLPRALIEAMSVACPALGARTAGIPELLDDRCIFSPGRIQQITQRISSIDQEWLIEQARRNFDVAKDYQKDILENRRKKFYKEFLSDHGFD